MLEATWQRVLALLSIVAAIGLVVVITDDPGPTPGTHHRTITVTLGGPGHDKVALPPAATKIVAEQRHDVAAGQPVAAEATLKDTIPAAPADAKAAEAITPVGQPEIPGTVPLAAASEPGCATALVRNYSSRRGAPVLLGMLHWTGSRATPGSPAGGRAIVRWFDTPAAQASSNYITDPEGRCWLTVAESQKSWTQAGFNPWSVSVEVINPGVLPLFGPGSAGERRVVALMRGWHRRWGLPYRRGRVAGCRVLRSGFLAHRDLGPCGGGHPDVGPSPTTLDRLIRLAAAGDKPAAAITQLQRLKCRKLRWWRSHGRPHGLPERNARKRRKYLERRGLVCPARGPVRHR